MAPMAMATTRSARPATTSWLKNYLAALELVSVRIWPRGYESISWSPAGNQTHQCMTRPTMAPRNRRRHTVD
jgi:hypothetical protein